MAAPPATRAAPAYRERPPNAKGAASHCFLLPSRSRTVASLCQVRAEGTSMLRLDGKLARIRSGAYSAPTSFSPRSRFGNGAGLQGAGPARAGAPGKWRTREAFIGGVETVIKQDVVDIMLVSVSNLERLVAHDAFAATGVKPAIRANDATDIWVMRGSPYATKPSRRSARLVVAGAVGRRHAAPQRQGRADRSRPLFRHLQRRSRRRPRVARSLQRVSRRRGGERLPLFSSKCSTPTPA